VLEAIVKDDALYIGVGEVRLALAELGFPKSPRELAKLVGYERPPSPLEGALAIQTGAGPQSIRVADALTRIANGEAELKGPFLQAVGKLPLEAQWDIVVHGSSQRGVKEPLHNLLIEIVSGIRKLSEPTFEKKAAELAANELPHVLVGDSFMRNSAIYGYLAAVVFDVEVDATAAKSTIYDDLAFRALCSFPFPWLVRRVAGLPRARRDAIIAKLKKEDETDSIDAIRAAR
jgi:hypothetical protein